MSAKKNGKRAKVTALAHPVAQNKDQVNQMIAEIGQLQRERERIRADMNDELATIRERYEAQAQPLGEKIKALSLGVQTWCEAHREDLTNGGRVKHALLAAGRINWRMRPPKVNLRGKDQILESLRTLGLTRFLRVIEDVNKEAMLAEPDVARTVAGVTITQAEDFVITPFETDLEEVA